MSKIYYMSKYALTQGIKTMKCVDEYTAEKGSGRHYAKFDGLGWFWFMVGKDAHETEAAAKAAAESMRLKKIASLKKQIAKLEVMKF